MLRLSVGLLLALALSPLRGDDTAPMPKPDDVVTAMKSVADWQLAHPDPKFKPRDWVYAVCDLGVMALTRTTSDTKYLDAMKAMGDANQWDFITQGKGAVDEIYMADNQAIGQTYAELTLQTGEKSYIAKMQALFDGIIANPQSEDLKFSDKATKFRAYSWCDSLMMSPPAWARLSVATGDPKYLQYTDHYWWITSDYLFDKDEHLYFRDDTFFPKREPNGQKIFWARGNGWVLAGLARMLNTMPADFPSRGKYVEQFQQMAEKLKTLQQPDGCWRSGLLDPVAHTQKEVSGTGLICFGLTYGINTGLLDKATYEPVVLKAWAALAGSVDPDGKLNNVQPVGAGPVAFDPKTTQPFGVGAFLLAGSEIYKLAGGVPATK